MAIEAWPYVVTRGRRSGFQAIVVPSFLEETGESYVLVYASKQEADDPGIVTIRDIIGSTVAPLAVAYRVTQSEPARYGLDEGTEFKDMHGRSIRVFEGLAVPLAAEQIHSNGVQQADFDAVAQQAAPAVHRLWLAHTRIDAEHSAKIAIGGDSPLTTRIVEPYVVPRY
jgi:hypothetical protein